MKQVLKCQKCAFEWNQRSDNPPQACPNPECRTRQWKRIDSLGVVVSAQSSAQSGSAQKESVRSAQSSAQSDPRFRDSVAAPGMYRVCVAHGLRYCKPCGTAAGIPASKPMTGTTRWCPWCDWRAKKPADDQPEHSELSQFSRHSAVHNPSAAQWTDAYNVIETQRRAAKARAS